MNAEPLHLRETPAKRVLAFGASSARGAAQPIEKVLGRGQTEKGTPPLARTAYRKSTSHPGATLVRTRVFTEAEKLVGKESRIRVSFACGWSLIVDVWELMHQDVFAGYLFTKVIRRHLGTAEIEVASLLVS